MRNNIENLQNLRDVYIKALASSENSTQKARELADNLFALDLTVYSKSYCFDSILYNSFSHSHLDDNICLHPEQISILNEIDKNNALIISAPTSFGKTFCIFEYIARKMPTNIVLIVPTLALVDEYLKKIIKKYSSAFKYYKIYTNVDENASYDFSRNNIFILTHDRVVHESSYMLIKNIDFLVIDEVYKLEKDISNDRVLILNLAYYCLAKLAKKYVLLAPFINNIEDREKLDKNPAFYKSMFSPVVNDVNVIEILTEKDRNTETKRILSRLNPDDKTLIYFPTVSEIYRYIKDNISNESVMTNMDEDIRDFLEWARDEIHEEWYLVKAMERGYLVHNGQLPIGTRLYQMDTYENSSYYSKMLCTSTLLEGVNTTAKNIIITKPSRKGRGRKGQAQEKEDLFSAFDFYNLVGRTGRLYQHYLGVAYYIKGPNDPIYKKIDAIKNIKFELTDESKDIDIQHGKIDNHYDYKAFLRELNISHDEYIKQIGGKLRFDTVSLIHKNYADNRYNLLTAIESGTIYPLITNLYYIIEGKKGKLESSIIVGLLINRQKKTKDLINDVFKYYGRLGLDYIITTVIRIKTSYLEYDFYLKTSLIKYIMENDGVDKHLISELERKILKAIEQRYYMSSKQRKMLIDLGIYERDIDIIIKVIGDDYDDTSELRKRLKNNYNILSRISFISRYVIKNIL
jgi:hypothetical protein